jgi:four helix bundle protein
MGDFRKLQVWQRARALTPRIVALIEKLPPHMRYDARSQLLEAAQSIRRNIAEGAGHNSDAQLARHLGIALASANEVQDELDALDQTGNLPPEDRDLIPEVAEIRAMIAAFRATVLKQIERKRSEATRKRPRSNGQDQLEADG